MQPEWAQQHRLYVAVVEQEAVLFCLHCLQSSVVIYRSLLLSVHQVEAGEAPLTFVRFQ